MVGSKAIFTFFEEKTSVLGGEWLPQCGEKKKKLFIVSSSLHAELGWQDHQCPQAGTNGYPIPDPNPKYFSILDPYPINFQNHRVFRVSGIIEKTGF